MTNKIFDAPMQLHGVMVQEKDMMRVKRVIQRCGGKSRAEMAKIRYTAYDKEYILVTVFWYEEIPEIITTDFIAEEMLQRRHILFDNVFNPFQRSLSNEIFHIKEQG